MFLVEIIQHMWCMGEIPHELGWTVLVLIPKDTTDTRGIGLLDTLWGMVEEIIDTRIRASLQFHEVLHGLRAGIWTGTAIMEMNLAQELLSVYHNHHFLVLFDLRKSYANVDRELLIQTLEGYGTVPCLCGLLENFWDHQNAVPRQNVYHGPAFPSTWGKTQVGLVSMTLFNMDVESVIRTWLDMTVEYQRVAHKGKGDDVERCLGVFYTNDRMVGSRDAEWLQQLMNILVSLFWRYGLAANVAKSRIMTCQTGVLRSGMSEKSKALKCTGVVDSYCVRLWQHIPCPECVFELTAGSMTSHCRCIHRTEASTYWNWLLVGSLPAGL